MQEPTEKTLTTGKRPQSKYTKKSYFIWQRQQDFFPEGALQQEHIWLRNQGLLHYW